MPNRIVVVTLVGALVQAILSFSAGASQSSSPPACREWHECRELALQAADRHDYEMFHDLAWRTVQTGPQREPDLMYLLARAQCLSGRPHDALIMLRRLAELGIVTDAAVNADFERSRALPGWPEVEALTAALTDSTTSRQARTAARPSASAATPSVSSAPKAAAAPTSPAVSPSTAPTPVFPESAAPGASAASPSVVVPTPAPPARAKTVGLPAFKLSRVEEAVRVSTPRFAAGGLAYDAVSRRFVVGDLHGGRLIVVSEGSDHAVDLVRADSAGFHEIRAIEIDWRRGDLWVVSATPDLEWSIHRLQLLSGRPLKAIAASKRLEPLTLVDLAVTPGGTVLVLDSIRSRLLVLRPRADTLEVGPQLRIDEASSVTATDEEAIAYVAHRGGITRVDLRTGSIAHVGAPSGLDLTGIERLRAHANGLLATQALSDGSRRIVQFELNGTRRAITSATVIDTSLPATTVPLFVTVSGDELSYLVAADRATSGQSDRDPSGAAAEFIVRRIHLQ